MMTHPDTFPANLPDPPVAPMTCPRCDRTYDSGESEAATLLLIKAHVADQHSDHDPEWAED